MIPSILGRNAANFMENNLPEANPKILLKNACKILNHAIDRTLFRQPDKNLGQSKRTLVTERTYNKLQEIIPKRIDIGKAPPYQEFSLCSRQAADIMHAQATEARQAASSPSSQAEETSSKFWNLMKSLMSGRSETEGLPSDAEGLLAKFNERGILALRAPGLDENYSGDHAVVIFSASKINVPGKGPKIVVGMIDCNDLASDPETKASWTTAAKLGKSHPSELTHEEANKSGAHLRRIRFADSDTLIRHIKDCTKNFGLLIQQEQIRLPEITFPKEKIPPLTPHEAEKLSQILVEIYDTPEVEKFEEQSHRRLEDNADAGRGKGRVMAQQLYKAMMKKD